MANGQNKNPAVAKAEETVNRVSGNSPQPQQQQQQQQQPTQLPQAGGRARDQHMGRAISANMMKTGFGFLGAALAEAVEDPLRPRPQQDAAIMGMMTEFGGNIADTMYDRWWRHDYDNFTAQHGEPYKEKMNLLLQDAQNRFNMIDRGTFVDENGIVQQFPKGREGFEMRTRQKAIAFRELTGKLSSLTNEYMSAGGKYINNPYVNAEMAMLMANQSQTIGGMFGPTPGMAAEQGHATIGETRAKEGYYDRMPAAGAGSSMKNRYESVEDMLYKKSGDTGTITDAGVLTALNILATNPDYNSFIAPEIRQATNLYEQEAIAKDEEKRKAGREHENLKADEHALDLNVGANTARINQIAAGNAVRRIIGEDRWKRIVGTRKGSHYTAKQPARVTDDYTPTQLKRQIDNYKKDTLNVVKRLIDAGEVSTYKELVDMVMVKLKNDLNKNFASSASATRMKIAEAIENYFWENPQEIADNVPEVSKLRGYRDARRAIVGPPGVAEEIGGFLGRRARGIVEGGKRLGGLLDPVIEGFEDAARGAEEEYE